jgi:hypothetical protein
VAQLGARLDGIEEVEGSNPFGSTKSSQRVLLPLHSSESVHILSRLVLQAPNPPFRYGAVPRTTDCLYPIMDI